MRKYLVQPALILSLLFLMTSCFCDPDTFTLGEDENQFIAFELNDIVRYKNIQTDSIIEFTVIRDSIFQFEESSNIKPLKFCTGNSDDTHETRSFVLESTDCIIEYSVSTEGNPAGISFSIYDCIISASGNNFNSNRELTLFQNGSYQVNGIEYSPVYILTNSFTRILVTPGIGVLSFRDEISFNEYVRIE